MKTGAWHCAQNADELRDWLYGRLAQTKGVTGINRHGETLEVRCEAIPSWAKFLAVLLFPIGLFFLLAKERTVLLVAVIADPGAGSTLSVNGGGTVFVERAMVEIYHQTAVTEESA